MSGGLLDDVRGVPIEGQTGRFKVELDGRWSFIHPSGGVLTSVALSAATRVLGQPALRLRSSTTTFCARLEAGALVVDARVLRRGARASQLEARVWAEGERWESPGLICVATFVSERDGPEVVGTSPPKVPHWSRCSAWPVRARAYPFFERFEERRALGHDWEESGWAPAAPVTARWLRYREAANTLQGDLDPIALPPVADLMPGAFLQALGPEAPRFFAPSLDLTVHVLDPSPGPWLLAVARGRRAAGGLGSAETEVWDDSGRLVAYATQTMLIRTRSRPGAKGR